jgi:transposase
MTRTAQQQFAIDALLECGRLTHEEIANQVRVGIRTIRRANAVLKAAKKKRNTKAKKAPVAAKPLTPRQQAVSDRRDIVEELAQTKKITNDRKGPVYPTARRIKERLEYADNIKVDRSTVQRDLKARGLKSYKRNTVTYELSDYNIRKRKNFAQGFVRKYSRQLKVTQKVLFDKLVFTDETYLDTNDHTSATQRAKSREDVDPRVQVNRFNILHIMVWGAIGVGYKSPLMRIPLAKNEEGKRIKGKQKRMDGKSYVNMLSRSGCMPRCHKDNRLFMQDGATCHTKGSTKTYITQTKQVHLIDDWPSASPDLNPIENLWALLKYEVAMLGKADSLEELWTKTQQAWNAIPQSKIDNFVRSFQGRINKCK